ncbi:MAG: hypothetical protein IH825_03780 [Candidatus Marinimicrobia bacterium]|nr:hypothetical protein [Candidatus Neomarinimicrobiota bacterium]
MAQIYTILGEYESALDRIEILLSIPAPISVSWLKLDPIFSPLHEIPRFRKLLEAGG